MIVNLPDPVILTCELSVRENKYALSVWMGTKSIVFYYRPEDNSLCLANLWRGIHNDYTDAIDQELKRKFKPKVARFVKKHIKQIAKHGKT